MIMPTSLHFPPIAELEARLEKTCPSRHARTLKEQGVITALAKFFAEDDRETSGIYIGIAHTMGPLKGRLGLSSKEFYALQMDLTQALAACADGKQIEIKRKSQL